MMETKASPGPGKRKRRQLAYLFSGLSLLLLLNFAIAFLSDAYDALGWNAPMSIALYSLAAAFVLSLVSVVLQPKSTVPWLAFLPALLLTIIVIAFLASFRFKM